MTNRRLLPFAGAFFLGGAIALGGLFAVQPFLAKDRATLVLSRFDETCLAGQHGDAAKAVAGLEQHKDPTAPGAVFHWDPRAEVSVRLKSGRCTVTVQRVPLSNTEEAQLVEAFLALMQARLPQADVEDISAEVNAAVFHVAAIGSRPNRTGAYIARFGHQEAPHDALILAAIAPGGRE